MGALEFRRAVREGVGVLVMLAGGTGSGKTMSALRLATGLSGGKRFAFIDSENRRGLHYADRFDFDHADLREPFTPRAYEEAVRLADAAGYPVIVVDSFSHEWAGHGGVLDMQEAELDRMAGDDWKKREACKIAAWIKPKAAHKQMVQTFLQLRAHLIVCLRAEPKVDIIREDGRTKIVPKESLVGHGGWIPITEKNFPFEATVSFMFDAARPGIPIPIKLQDQHKPFFPLDRPVAEGSGRELAGWALGDSALDRGRAAALMGMVALQDWWAALSREQKAALKDELPGLKNTAVAADETPEPETPPPPLDPNDPFLVELGPE